MTNNCKYTTLDTTKIPEVGSDDYTYSYCDEFKNLKTLEDFAKYKDDGKLIGYLTQDTIKILESLSQNASLSVDKPKEEYIKCEHPRIYFEYEGWDKIYFLEFVIGQPIVNCGSHAFNFNTEYYEELYSGKKIENDDEVSDEVYEKIYEIRKHYMLNLIFDKFTKWNTSKLDSSIKESNEIDIGVLMSLAGLRREDYLDNPEEARNHLKKVFGLKM